MNLKRIKAAGSVFAIIVSITIPIILIASGLVSGWGAPDAVNLTTGNRLFTSGFLVGLWDGLIVVITLPWSAFNSSVAPVSGDNITGISYYLGYFASIIAQCFVVFWRPRSQ